MDAKVKAGSTPIEPRRFRLRSWRRLHPDKDLGPLASVPVKDPKGTNIQSYARLSGDRGDHIVHQHLQPDLMIGAGLLARNAVKKV